MVIAVHMELLESELRVITESGITGHLLRINAVTDMDHLPVLTAVPITVTLSLPPTILLADCREVATQIGAVAKIANTVANSPIVDPLRILRMDLERRKVYLSSP